MNTKAAPTLKIWRPKQNLKRWMTHTRIFTFTTGFREDRAIFNFLNGTLDVPAWKFVHNCEMAPREYWN